MEAIEARALKPSLRGEISMKPTQQAFLDDLWCLNGGNGIPGEEFSVDDLLDLSNENFEEEEEEEEKDSDSISSQDRVDDDKSNSSAGDLDAFPAVPVDDWKDLDWVSQFVDDSKSELSLLYPVKDKPVISVRSCSETALQRPPRFPAKIPAKTRSKRARTTSRCWSLFSPLLTVSFTTAPFSSMASAQATEVLCSLEKPSRKRQRKITAGSTAAAVQPLPGPENPTVANRSTRSQNAL